MELEKVKNIEKEKVQEKIDTLNRELKIYEN